MKLLEERILKDGKVLPGTVLKVGNFLNQQVDTVLLNEMAEEAYKLFNGSKVDKVLSIEASGLPFATAVAMKFGVPMVFAKKHKSANMSGDIYSAEVYSYTHGETYTIAVTKDYIKKGENILICDDFLAVGNALKGLIKICDDAGGIVAGCCCQIEKCFQGGGDELRKEGYKVESLACIESMSGSGLTFRK